MASCSSDSLLVDDLATISELTEKTLLEHLERRYAEGVIYTYVGDILVAVNPFKDLPLYTDEIRNQYRDVRHRVFVRPHVYMLAHSAYHALRRSGQSQCCIVSGESGAGKTETAKFFVQHLLQLCRSNQPALQYQIVESSPLLEAFGNAQTEMNDNSSRFGKYLEIHFTAEGVVTGATLSEYLLEKSRVVHQGKGERNFHIFYYIFSGLSQSELATFHLSTFDQHRCLRRGNGSCMTEAEKESNRTKFEVLKRCMGIVGFSSQDTIDMLTLLASILHAGDIDFEVGPDDAAKTVNKDTLKAAAELMGVDPELFEQILTSTRTVTRGEAIIRFNSVDKACDCRDATAKALYGRLFQWIVSRVNHLLHPEPVRRFEKTATISILDIFGFENFEVNSFEQLCINVANEQLQYYFNQHIFAWEQEEYQKEGVDLATVTYTDNKPLIDVFLQRPVGLFHLLDEESHFPKASDTTLVEKFHSQLSKQTGIYVEVKRAAKKFGIIHYAGEVVYTANRFLEKNRDTLNDDILDSLQQSRLSLVADLFQSKRFSSSLRRKVSGTVGSSFRRLSRKPSIRHSNMNQGLHRQNSRHIKSRRDSGSRGIHPAVSRTEVKGSFRRKNIQAPALQTRKTVRRPMTVGAQFRQSLSVLMDKMLSASPQFVRCIKPNTGKEPMKFDDLFVLKQLKYTGLLETTRIRREGYPSRLLFEEFLNRYGFIAFPPTSTLKNSADECTHVLRVANLRDWCVGRTKVFLRYYHPETLYQVLEEKTSRVTTVQKMVRGWLVRRHMGELKARLKGEAFTLETFLHGIQVRCHGLFDRCLKLMENDTARVRRNRKVMQIAQQREQQELDRLEREKELAQKEALNRLHAQAAREAAQAALQLRQEQGRKQLQEQQRRLEEERKLKEDEERRRAAAEAVAREAEKEAETIDTGAWCRVVCMERSTRLADYLVSQDSIVVDGSTGSFDPNKIGFNSLMAKTRRDSKVSKFRKLIGKGIEITRDGEGSVWVVRRSKNPMFVKGWSDTSHHCMASEVAEHHGLLHRHTPVMIFDFPKFDKWLKVECSVSTTPNQRRLIRMCKIGISFVKDYQHAADTPCWLELVFEAALSKAKKMGVASRQRLYSGSSKSPDVASVCRAIGLRYKFLSQHGSEIAKPPTGIPRLRSGSGEDWSLSGSIGEEMEEDIDVNKPRTKWAKETYQSDRYALAAAPFISPAAAAALRPNGERELVVPHRRTEKARLKKGKAKKVVKYALGLH